LSELADYRKTNGHCNIPQRNSGNTKLAYWVGTQRNNYRLHREGKASYMTLSRIQELESMGFEWDCSGATWEDRLSELADYRKIHGHCNVPSRYNENTKLGQWVSDQRTNYRFQLEGKKSFLTLSRIQALNSLGFEWKPSISGRKRISKKSSLDDNARHAHKKPVNSKQGADSRLETAPFIFRATGYC
jgi:hypothetical protein